MLRTYRFFDKEDYRGRKITFDFPQPFYENLDRDLKDTYGEELTFVKEINHRDHIIRLHSAYDSGKGTRYVAPVIKERKKRRVNLDIRVQQIFDENVVNEHRILKIENGIEGEHIFFCFYNKSIHIFSKGSYSKGSVSGYRNGIDNEPNSLYFYLKRLNYYPEKFVWLE